MKKLLKQLKSIDIFNYFNFHIVGNEIHSDNVIVTDELEAMLIQIEEIANISCCADIYSDKYQFYITIK